MKKLFLILLSSFALGAEEIVLDTKFTDAHGNESSQMLAADTLAQRCQAYAELGLYGRIINDIETEHSQLSDRDSARLQELTDLLSSHMEVLLRAHRNCDVRICWNGDQAYGSTSYRTKDLPPELQKCTAPVGTELYQQWQRKIDAYIEQSPDAGMFKEMVIHLLRGEIAPARDMLTKIRREHPTYCPERLQQTAERLVATPAPTRLECMLLALRLPVGTFYDIVIVESTIEE